ncbi:subtilase-type protease inhibitor [Streptomyces sp. TRM64462]|uniref:subtilase-type protease inhibitor n=1 Tax=Streptomyces sp. TRM64462 TaxID=2741726 RepID=UPI002815F260|nr:subtilase-type protease inhibitor [Streptomyces sp. TRM64462]
MWTPLRRTAVCGLVTAAALATLAPAASAVTEADGTADTRLYAPSALVLTVGQGETAATSVPLRAVTLTCTPAPGGTHPSPQRACDTLHAVKGEFGALSGTEERACIKIYDPVVVTAQGVWDGQRVNFERTFGNACEMRAEGTSVFAF